MKIRYFILIALLLSLLTSCGSKPNDDSVDNSISTNRTNEDILTDLRSRPVESKEIVQIGDVNSINGSINFLNYFPIDKQGMIFLMQEPGGRLEGVTQSLGKRNVDGFGEAYCLLELGFSCTSVQYSSFNPSWSEDQNRDKEVSCYTIDKNGDIYIIGNIENDIFKADETPNYIGPAYLDQNYNKDLGNGNGKKALGVADITINGKTYKECLLLESTSIMVCDGITSAYLAITYYCKDQGPVYWESRSLLIEDGIEDYSGSCSFVSNEPGANISLYDALQILSKKVAITNIEYKWSDQIGNETYYVFGETNNTNDNQIAFYYINQQNGEVIESFGNV